MSETTLRLSTTTWSSHSKAGVKNKSLKQSKGTGASGSFKIVEVAKPVKKKPAKVKKAVKPKAAKPKTTKTRMKTTTKKTTSTRKATGEKKEAKPKAKKPAAKKATKTKKMLLNPKRQRPRRRSRFHCHKQPFSGLPNFFKKKLKCCTSNQI